MSLAACSVQFYPAFSSSSGVIQSDCAQVANMFNTPPDGGGSRYTLLVTLHSSLQRNRTALALRIRAQRSINDTHQCAVKERTRPKVQKHRETEDKRSSRSAAVLAPCRENNKLITAPTSKSKILGTLGDSLQVEDLWAIVYHTGRQRCTFGK
jgi:hypothetical protein